MTYMDSIDLNQGFANFRDLGEIQIEGRDDSGERTASNRYFRSGTLKWSTSQGWKNLVDRGLDIIIDLRNPGEESEKERYRGEGPFRDSSFLNFDLPVSYSRFVGVFGIPGIQVPIDNIENQFLWDEIRASNLEETPLYYEIFINGASDHIIGLFKILSRLSDQSILIHCSAGRDRTGLVSAMLLKLAGVSSRRIADDYCLSTEAVSEIRFKEDKVDPKEKIEQRLALYDLNVHSAMMRFISEFDVEKFLREGGLTSREIVAIINRFGPVYGSSSPSLDTECKS